MSEAQRQATDRARQLGVNSLQMAQQATQRMTEQAQLLAKTAREWQAMRWRTSPTEPQGKFGDKSNLFKKAKKNAKDRLERQFTKEVKGSTAKVVLQMDPLKRGLEPSGVPRLNEHKDTVDEFSEKQSPYVHQFFQIIHNLWRTAAAAVGTDTTPYPPPQRRSNNSGGQ